MNEETKQSSIHIPVLLQEVIDHLALKEGDVIFDGTLGGGGYTRRIREHITPGGLVIATDQDIDAIERLNQTDTSSIEVHHSAFSHLKEVVGDRMLDGAVLDLGISSDQLSDRERGISFANTNAPLDMRMNQSPDNHLTAWGILNTWDEEEIADALYWYGEERNSRRIARSIVERRSTGEMETVGDLIAAVEETTRRSGKTHPATKTFQALRLVVNDELGELERFLEEIQQYMNSGGRVVIVSFHSLEDRIVKQTFRRWKEEGKGLIVTKKVVAPTREESQVNPRSRSSKLRTFEFINN